MPTVTFNGTSYSIPANRQAPPWGAALTTYLVALANNAFSKAGGNFTLTADADFGASFGLKSAYFKSRSANIAAAGVVRLANAETVSWRNAANGADIALAISALDRLTIGGVNIPSISSTDTLTNKTLTSPVLDGSLTGSGIKDEDNMVSDSATAVPTQQSVKAYVDTAIAGVDSDVSDVVADLATHEDDTSVHGVTGDVVGTSDSQTLTNKTLTSPVISTISNTGTLTLPTSTDTLIGRATTDTLTNKTLTSPVLNGSLSGTGIDVDPLLAADSDTKVASQKAVKAYIDAATGGLTPGDALDLTAGVLDVLVDGTTVTINGSNQLQVPTATSSTAGLIPRYQTTTSSMNNVFSSGTATFTRIGNVVTIHVTASSHPSSSSPSCLGGFVPADYRPAGDTRGLLNFNGSIIREIIVKSTGNLEFEYRDWAGSTASATTTEFASSITYTV